MQQLNWDSELVLYINQLEYLLTNYLTYVDVAVTVAVVVAFDDDVAVAAVVDVDDDDVVVVVSLLQISQPGQQERWKNWRIDKN